MSDKDSPLVSVIIPTYSRPQYLEDAITSVLEQTYSNIELVVVDDNSPTPAKTIIDKSELDLSGLSNFVCIRHNENKGVCAGRNTGIRRSQGDLIALLDDDDRWDPLKIEKQVEAFKEATDDVGVVYSGVRWEKSNGTVTRSKTPKHEGNVTRPLLFNYFIALPTVMVRRDVVNKAGLFDEEIDRGEDKEWVVRLSQYCQFKPVPEPLLIIRQNPADEGRSEDYDRHVTEHNNLVEKLRPIAADLGRWEERKFMASSDFGLAWSALRNERYSAARVNLVKAIIKYPFNIKYYKYLLASIGGKYTYKTILKIRRKIDLLLTGESQISLDHIH